MRYRRNADESDRRRERARAIETDVHQAVVDKLRAGRSSEITLGELAGVSDPDLVRAIPSPLWQALLDKVGLTPRNEEIPVQIGPVRCSIQIATNDEDYPSIYVSADGYARNGDYPILALEHVYAEGGPLRAMVYGNPFDQDGAPTHYLEFIPFRKDLDERWWDQGYFPPEAGQEVWDANEILGNP